jgi:regulator of telomere elongation helicase 1
MNNSPFWFNYNNKDNINMFLELGYSIFEIIKKVPHGVLIFFTSYALLDKCYNLWERYGIIDDIE